MTFYQIIALTEDVRCLNFCQKKARLAAFQNPGGGGRVEAPEEMGFQKLPRKQVLGGGFSSIAVFPRAGSSSEWLRALLANPVETPWRVLYRGHFQGQVGPCTAFPPKRSRWRHEVLPGREEARARGSRSVLSLSRAARGPRGGTPAGPNAGPVWSASHSETQRRGMPSAVCVGDRGVAASF